MENKERFDQIESLLVSLIQKVDRQEQFNARQEQFNARQEQFNTRQEQFNARQEQFNAGLSNQMQDVINILKMSVERQDKLLQRIEAQGRRTDAIQAEILRMLEKWDEQDARNEAIAKRLDNHEPRIQRLEDDALRQAS